MQQRLTELLLERARLQERIAAQRDTLALRTQPLARSLQFGDWLARWWLRCRQFAVEHPLAVAGAVGVIVVLRPAGAWRWTQRGLLVWRTWTSLRKALPAFLARQI